MNSILGNAILFFSLDIPVKDKNEIKKKYKELSMKYHPDRGGTNEKFVELQNHRDTLYKYFDEINQTAYDIKDKKEKLDDEFADLNSQFNGEEYQEEKEPGIISKGIDYLTQYIKYKLSTFFYYIGLKLNYIYHKLEYFVLFVLFKYLGKIFFWSIFGIITLIPISFFGNGVILTAIEPNYIHEGSITTFEEYKTQIISKTGINTINQDIINQFNLDYTKKINQQYQDTISLVVKIILIYFLLLTLYSFLFFKIKKNLEKLSLKKNINLKIFDLIKLKKVEIIDFFYSNMIKNIKIYYLVGLYTFMILISYFIYLILLLGQ